MTNFATSKRAPFTSGVTSATHIGSALLLMSQQESK